MTKLILWATGIISAIIIIAALGQHPSTPVDPHTAECRQDFHKCSDNADMINNYSKMFDAKYDCKEALSKSVKYGTPEWSWIPFGSFYRGDDYVRTGLVKIVDKDVKIQNIFGAKVNSIVECWYDFNKQSALIVNASNR